MTRVKIFSGDNLSILELEINKWFETQQGDIAIRFMCQSVCEGIGWTISICYQSWYGGSKE